MSLAISHTLPLLSKLRQPSKGFRFGLDSFLLAKFARFQSGDVVCDLGAGVGILSFLALWQGKVSKVTAVEIQKELMGHLEANRSACHLEDKMDLVLGDWRKFGLTQPRPQFSVVISNPPYQKMGEGRVSPDVSRQQACHEVHGDMASLLSCAKRILAPQGRLVCIYPAQRLDECLVTLKETGLKVQRMAAIHPYRNRPARHVMLEAVGDPRRELTVESPVIIYRDPDHYEPEIEALVGPKHRR